MNIKRMAVVGFATVALASACSSTVHGTVTGKQYIPGYTTYLNQPVYTRTCVTVEEEEEEPEPGGGEEPEEEPEQQCTNRQTGTRLVPLYHPDCWQLSVSGKQGGDECVSEKTYDDTKVGSTV